MQLILSFAGQKAMKSLEPVLAVRAITRRSATNFRHMWISLAAHMLLLTLPRTGWAPVVSSDSPLSHAGSVTGQPHMRNLDRWTSLIDRGDVPGLHPVTLKPDERRASTQHAQSQTTPFHDSSHATARSASGRRLSSTLRSRSRIRPHRRVLPPVGLQRSCDPVEGGGHPDLRGYRSEKVPLTRCVTHKANSAPQTSMWRWWVPAGTRR
jgi:hypothetical protein